MVFTVYISVSCSILPITLLSPLRSVYSIFCFATNTRRYSFCACIDIVCTHINILLLSQLVIIKAVLLTYLLIFEISFAFGFCWSISRHSYISGVSSPSQNSRTSYYLRIYESGFRGFREIFHVPRNQLDSTPTRKTLISRPSIIHIDSFTRPYIYTPTNTRTPVQREGYVWTSEAVKNIRSIRAEM